MGNTAIIKPIDKNIGVYLHWNGGNSSVTAFLRYCELKQYRDFGGKNADGYGLARFCQVVGNFFGGTCSIGIETNVTATEKCADGLDNGIYVVDGWKVVKHYGTQYKDNYDLTEMLIAIDEAQPGKEQLGKDFIEAEEVESADLEIGDTVFIRKFDGEVQKCTVEGFTTDYSIPAGDRPLIGNPFVNAYPNQGEHMNPNNIIKGKIYRAKKGA